ncbi:hypothetical protein DMI70_11295 [Escherichia coli]|nr:hypothetical protein [Escherichia coli]
MFLYQCRSWSSKSGVSGEDWRAEYAPHVINTPLAFLIKSALNTNILVNRAGRVLAGEQVVIYNGMT